jgi:hypothetical protein
MHKCISYDTGMERQHSSHDLGTGVNVVCRQDSKRIQGTSDIQEDSNTNRFVDMKGTRLLGEYLSFLQLTCFYFVQVPLSVQCFQTDSNTVTTLWGTREG